MSVLPPRLELYPEIVRRMAAERPGEVFAYSVSGGEMTWGEVHEEALTWAGRFVSLGVGQGAMVASMAESDLAPLCWWTGLSYVGAVEVSICHEFRGRMLAYAINNSGASVLLVTQKFLPLVESVAAELEHVSTVVVTDGPGVVNGDGSLASVGAADIAVPGGAIPVVEQGWHDIACVVYTSGTTGPSKAVLMPWGQLHSINVGMYPVEDLGPDDVVYGVVPSYHMGAKTQPYLAALIGGKVVLRERFSATEFWPEVERYGITTTAIVGPVAQMLLDNPQSPGSETTLHNVLMAPIIPRWVEFNERFGTRLCTIFNSTEMSIPLHSVEWNPIDRLSCGRARKGYPGYEVRIVDEHDYEVEPGVAGEVIVRTATPWALNAGYLNNPEATATAWRNGWFHTGDAMTRNADGDFYFVDRLKDVIRRRGENVSSFEVEADVLAHPGVAECAAVGVPADIGEEEIMLFVVPRTDSGLTPEALVLDLAPRMARFMVPRYIEFVDVLPRTVASMRVQKSELRKRGVGPNTWDREAAGIDIPRASR